MSELMTTEARADFRWQLLTTASALAICGVVYAVDAAHADDADRPTVWIELGGQLERVQGGQDPFLPPFLLTEPRPDFEKIPSAETQRPSRYAIGGEARAIFAPKGTDWQFLAAVRFGRSNSPKHLHQQLTTYQLSGVDGNRDPFYAPLLHFSDTVSAHAESHAVIDFMAGRDVGLGFGRSGTTTLDFGVRYAQFTARGSATLREHPDPYILRIPNGTFLGQPKYTTKTHHHSFYAHNSISRSFSGIGPSLSFSGSQSFIGNADAGEVVLDWGVNAAVLFGRQKVRGDHKTSGIYVVNFATKSSYNHTPPTVVRSRSVVVPNVGGFAGLTFHRGNAKVSLGYRADFFFGAVDAGIDTRHSENLSFHGPFATIGIGLGG